MSAAMQLVQTEPLVRTKFKLADHAYNRFSAVVKAGVTKEDLESPVFWEHICNQVTEFDEVRAIAEDGSFIANLVVVAKVANCVYMRVVWGLDLDPPDMSAATTAQNKYEVKYMAQQKWCVVNNENGELIKSGIPSKSKAQRELEEYLLALSR